MPQRAPAGILLEICVESVADARAAAEGGADRLELNSALALDGLTPSLGLLREVRRAVGRRFPVIAMARPRAGDFCYNDADFRVLRRDVDLLLENGADGVAFGILTPDGDVDVKRCRQLTRGIDEAVFHRAFDRVREPFSALQRLIDLGVRRVMTSGQAADAVRGGGRIAELIRVAGGRIEILPAGGIRPGNARQVIATTGCDQLHSSLRDSGTMSPQLLSRLVTLLRAHRP
jgi:copper homeostasis protein